MAILRTMQPAFTAGELSPALWARVDLAKYQSGLKRARNVFIHAHGGVSNRPGLQFVGETKTSGPARQIPFIYDPDTDQTYNLVFTHLKLRFFRMGSPILEAAKAISAISQANPGVVTANAHGFANGDEIVVTDVVGMGGLNGRNFIVRNVTTNSFRLEDMFGAAVDTSAMPAYAGGGAARRVYEIATPYATADLPKLVVAQEKDVMYIAHVNHAPRKLSRFADANWTLTTLTFAPAMAAPSGLTVSARYKFRSGSGANYGFRVSAVSATGARSAASAQVTVWWQYENFDARYIQVSWNAVAGAAYYLVYRSDASGGIVAETANLSADMPSGGGSFSGDGSAIPGSADAGAPATPTGVSAKVQFGREYTYVISAVSSASGEESLPSAEVSVNNDMAIKGNLNVITWSALTGASKYIIYRNDNGLFGYVGTSETTTFTDENIVPDVADGPQSGNNPFVGIGNYPRCITFFEQRLAFAGTLNEPSAVYLGQSANYENFGSASPAKASDAITFRIRSREKNEVRALVPSRGLGVFSSAAEWTVSGGSEDFLSPANTVIRLQSNRGCSYLQPLVVGNVMLFPQARGGVVRDFSYEFANDSFTGSDLTVMARHLFADRRIVSWAYAQSPNSIVWAVLDNGALVSLTYMREHEVWGWTHHVTDGVFEDVNVVPERDEDAVYFVVRREVNGQQKRYVERLHSRDFLTSEAAFFVDCGLSYAGAAVSTVSGLHHLEGKEVVALSNGNVVRGLTVANGAVTLPNPTTRVHIGLPYAAEIETLDIDLGMLGEIGSVQGRFKSIASVTARVEKTRGLFVGPTSDKLIEYKQRAAENWDEAIQLFTGDIEITLSPEYTKGGTVVVRQTDPLPMTILALMPDLALGR